MRTWRRRERRPLACVLGDTDIMRPLGLAGIPCAVVAARRSSASYSRYAKHRIDWVEPSEEPERLVEVLVAFAQRQEERPVLVYQGDGNALVVSRYRDALAPYFRFVIPSAELVENSIDKSRFLLLADRLGLPVPPSRLLDPAREQPPKDLGIGFPVVLKPVMREPSSWRTVARSAKAIAIATPSDLNALWPALASIDRPLIAQQLIAGPESRVESYHAYIDRSGEIVGEFTGAKIRTWPTGLGHSSAVVITDQADIRDLGRKLMRDLGMTGVVKLDIKRDGDNRLFLLEVNTKFTLWHHPAARAGVNIPALVYADLTGRRRPPVGPVRPGVTWCKVWGDLPAAREEGTGLARWAWWTVRCETKHDLAWNDPGPLIGLAWAALRSRRVVRAA